MKNRSFSFFKFEHVLFTIDHTLLYHVQSTWSRYSVTEKEIRKTRES